MWNYVVINSGEEYGDFLAHSAKGTTWGKHKYIKKETKGGKTRYYYAEQGKTPAKQATNDVTDDDISAATNEYWDAANAFDDIAEKNGHAEDSKTNPGWKVSSADTSKMSPEELVAYKKREYKRKKLNELKARREKQAYSNK